MEIRISMTDGALTELESLNDWLGGERELAGRVKLASAEPREGELGALSESLVVAAATSPEVPAKEAST